MKKIAISDCCLSCGELFWRKVWTCSSPKMAPNEAVLTRSGVDRRETEQEGEVRSLTSDPERKTCLSIRACQREHFFTDFQGTVVAGRAEKTLVGVHCVARPARARDFSRARDSVSYVAHIAPDSRPRTPLTSRPAPAASALSAPLRPPLLRDFYSRSPPPPPEKARKIRLQLVLKYSEFRAGQDCR